MLRVTIVTTDSTASGVYLEGSTKKTKLLILVTDQTGMRHRLEEQFRKDFLIFPVSRQRVWDGAATTKGGSPAEESAAACAAHHANELCACRRYGGVS
jgi:hypothetical protein